MEPVRPRKGSRGSKHSGSGSPQSEKSSSRNSSRTGSRKSPKKVKGDEPPPEIERIERDSTFAEEEATEEPAGYVLQTTDTSDEEPEEPASGMVEAGPSGVEMAQFDEQDLEPHLDEEAVKAELGGDLDQTETQGIIEPNDSKETKTTEEEEDEEEVAVEAKKGKKRGLKLRKKSEKRVTYDGREVVFVTEFTQTDWKWREKAEKTGKAHLMTPSSESESRSSSSLKSVPAKPDPQEATSRPYTEESTMDDRTTTDLTPFSLQPNDEFGIPVLDISSDSDTSADEAPRKPKFHKHHLPSIGPPQILKYIRESDRMDSSQTDKTSSDMDDDFRQIDSADFVLDEQGNVAGMFSGPCEFCRQEIRPFPTLEQQLSQPPESLYCCEDYREFVEFAMTTANRLEEDAAKKTEKISVKVHGHHGSKQARKMAKEQAVQRMRERELQRRQQEATGIQQAFYQSRMGTQLEDEDVPDAGKKKGKGKKTKGKGKKGGGGKKGEGKTKDGAHDGRHDAGYDRGVVSSPELGEEEMMGELEALAAMAGPVGGRGGAETGRSGGTAGGGRGSSVAREDTGGFQPRQPAVSASFTSFAGLGSEVARQMKTINYQLSSQKCLEEGWTLRAPSPLEPDDIDCEVFVPEPLHPVMIASGKIGQRKLIEKYYPDGKKFLTMFPDGTGNVFYPSGYPAILIISLALGQYTYIVQDDAAEPEILATFDPNGYGCCYFASGKVRLTYDQLGGIELDHSGAKKRVWSWRDQETHVHAPPFQPIVFGMNRYLGVRFMAQESIALTLTGRKRSCRFNVGSKLKLINPANLPPKEVDENQLFIDERKIKVDHILNKVTNLLKFPKSPKIDRLLPPLALSARQQKVDKMKQEYAASLTVPTSTPGRKKKVVNQRRLSPIPFVSVN